MASIGNIFVKLGLDTADFQKRMKRTRSKFARSMKKMQRGVRSLVKPLGVVTGLMGVMGGISFGALINSTNESVDALAKHADRLGLTTEALGGLRFAAQQTGSDVKGLDVGLQRMVRRVADAAAGNKGLTKTFNELGLNAQELVKLSPDQQFLKISDAIKEIPNQGERVRQTFKIFDTEGVKLKNLLDQGSEGVSALTSEFNDLGGSISRVDAAKIEMANDATNRMKVAFTGIKQKLAVELAPWILTITDYIKNLSVSSGGFKDQISKGVDVLETGMTAGIRVVESMRAAILTMGAISAEIFARVKGFWDESMVGFRLMKTDAQILWKNIKMWGVSAAEGAKIAWATMLDSIQVKMGELMVSAGKLATESGFDGRNLVLEGVAMQRTAKRSKEAQKEAAKAISEHIKEIAVLKQKRAEILTNGMAASEASKLTVQGIRVNLSKDISKWSGVADKLQSKLSEFKTKTDEAALKVADQAEQNINLSGGDYVSPAAGASAAASKIKEAQKEIDTLMQSAQELLTTDAQRIQTEIDGWQKLLDAGKISHEEFDQLTQKSLEQHGKLEDSWNSLGDKMGNALSDFVQNGKLDFKGLADSMLSDMARVSTKLLTDQLFGGGEFGGSSGGLFGGILKGIGGLFSFDGGGYTGSGSRSGGMDGKGGFLAMLHPRETVVDHTKMKPRKAGSGQVVNITENINVQPGVSREELRVTLQEVERLRDEKMRRLRETGQDAYAGI